MSPQKLKRVQKRLRFGIEIELFTLDEKGYMTNGADRLINRVKKLYPEVEIKREFGKNMIEFTTPPNLEVPDAMYRALEDYEKILSCATEEKLVLYSYGTYPGSFVPEGHATKRYRALEKIYGKQRYAIMGRCCGLHIHYSLPWGVFDYLHKIIKPLIRSKNAESLVNIYNLCIAIDPALTALTQSSPFYQGAYIGKDSRMIVGRGGKELDYPEGMYANLPLFGALQEYKSTNTDILHLIKERFEDWGMMVKKAGYSLYTLTKHGSILDNTWNPVKINAHGTMEVRGLDINHPDIIAAAAVLLKFIIKAVQEKYIAVKPGDSGIDNPFSFDGETIIIPPSTYVRSTLQKASAYEGLENEAVYKYCASLIKLADHFIPKEKRFLLQPFDDMLAKRETSSDRILKIVKEKGWNKESLSSAEAAELALILSNHLYKEVITTKERLKEFLEK